MIVTTETATVFKGGGRRFFSKKSAYNSAARSKIKSRCKCESPHLADFETGYMPEICHYHEDHDRYEKLKARLARWYKHIDLVICARRGR